MFDELEEQFNQLNKMSISIPIEADEEGYIDKECPNEECMFQFKVSEQDWLDIFIDEAVYCPLCGHDAPSDSFWTTEQIENGKRQAIGIVQNRINKALQNEARSFNRRQPKNSFIQMSMTFKGSYGRRVPIPIVAKEAFELKIQCEECKAHFSVIGSAYFCPSCGYNSVERTYEDSLIKIEAKINNIDAIKAALSEVSKDEAEIVTRSIIESSMSDCVVAFQRYCSALYSKHPSKKERISQNAFQRLDDGSKLWTELFGEGYEEWLSSAELARLLIYFQRRHLLAHCEGIVDDIYVSKSGDNSYKVGQRIIIKHSDIRESLKLIKKLSDAIRTHIDAASQS